MKSAIRLIAVALAAMCFAPGCDVAIRQAANDVKINKARAEVRALNAALKTYYNEYSKLPLAYTGKDMAWGESGQKAMLDVLLAADATNNPKRIVFMEVENARMLTKGPLAGCMLDPWGKPYRIAVDGNYDNQVEPAGRGFTIAVWSCGPNRQDERGQGDDIRSW